jgi:hypothetical protein
MQVMTKKQVLEAALRGEGCLGKAHDDEPVFVLVAHDNLSAETVDFWATRANLTMPVVGSEGTGHKINGARQTADAMRDWPFHKNPD